MEQDTASSGEAFEPSPLMDILRSDASPAPEPARETAQEPAPAEAADTGETPEQTAEERQRDERGRFAPKPEAQAPAAPPAAQQNAPPQSVPVSAVQEERKKRQALERELQELRASLAPQQQAPQPPPVPEVRPADLMFQDPDAYVQYQEQRQQQALLQTRFALSEFQARQLPDFAEAEAAVLAAAAADQREAARIGQAMYAHPAPALWAYEEGKRLIAQQRWAPIVQQHADPEAYIAAEIERRVAERQAPTPAPSAAPRLPTSLATARAAAPRSGPGWAGPSPLTDILGPRR